MTKGRAGDSLADELSSPPAMSSELIDRSINQSSLGMAGGEVT